MGIFERLVQMAKAEVNDIKRVLRETDGDPRHAAEAEERERKRLVAEAEAALARAEGDVERAEADIGAAPWGSSTPAAASAPAAADADLARGAAVWGAAASASPAAEPARREVGGAFPSDVREAYAALELPLGADLARVATAVAALEARLREPPFATDPRLAAVADDRLARARAARALLEAWQARRVS